jgi:hypothetical protein
MKNKLGIKINGAYLDINPGTVIDMESTTPLFQNIELEGEYSYPFELPVTAHNNKLLGYGAHFGTLKEKLKIEATIYDGNNIVGNGFLFVDGATNHLNRPLQGSYSCYYVTSISYLFSILKDKKLKDIFSTFIYTKNWTTNNPTDSTNGFWQHIHHTTTNPLSYPYVFYPIRNDNWRGNQEPGSEDFMNKCNATGYFDYNRNIRTLCPALRYSWMLQQIVEHIGWTLTGSTVEDSLGSGAILTMPSMQSIDWAAESYVSWSATDPSYYVPIPNSTVTWNLGDHVPNWTAAKFLIEWTKYFNLGMDVNDKTKTISFKRNEANTYDDDNNITSVDLTSITNPNYKFTIDEAKHYSLKRNFDSGDGAVLPPDFGNLTLLPTVNSVANLPTPTVDKVCLVYDQNNYYRTVYDSTTTQFEWQYYTSNIYDYIHPQETDSFTCDITPINTRPTYFSNDNTALTAVLPIMSQQGNFHSQPSKYNEWQPRILMYLGVQGVGPTTAALPVASHTYFTMGSTATLSISFSNKAPGVSGNDYGIYRVVWSEWLTFLSTSITFSLTQYPNYLQLQAYNYNETYLVRNVPFRILKKRYSVPHSGEVELECKRV